MAKNLKYFSALIGAKKDFSAKIKHNNSKNQYEQHFERREDNNVFPA